MVGDMLVGKVFSYLPYLLQGDNKMQYLIVKNNRRGVYHKIQSDSKFGFTICGIAYTPYGDDAVQKHRPEGLRICKHCVKQSK